MNGSRLPAQQPEDANWAAFTANLAEFLYDLMPGAKLILAAEGNRYVQFAAEKDGLDAEVVSNAYLKDPWRLSDADHQALAAAGWTRPEGRHENWQRQVLFTSQNCAAVAERSIEALRTVLRVSTPSQLSPKGWVDQSGFNSSQIDLTDLGLGQRKVGLSDAGRRAFPPVDENRVLGSFDAHGCRPESCRRWPSSSAGCCAGWPITPG